MTTSSDEIGLLTWGEPRARWVLGATVLGSALTFIDATVVNIALPAIGEDLNATTTRLTWVVNAYTLVLAALVLLGGSLGDRFGRRNIFVVGVLLFAAASALCGLAPNAETLVAARALQGAGGALLTPASLAILQASFAPGDRARAIGAWSGLTGVAAAIGPFLGGWLVEVANWRWVFLINLPVALVVVVVARRHVPETRNPGASKHLDVVGSLALACGLGALTFGLTAWSGSPLITVEVGGPLVAGLVLLVAFGVWEHAAPEPLLPLAVFTSRLFVAANVITFILYAALGAVFFALVVALQVGAGFAPLAAGLSLLPVTVLMLVFSSRAGALMSKVGPGIPMTVGPLVAAVGVALLSRIDARVELPGRRAGAHHDLRRGSDTAGHAPDRDRARRTARRAGRGRQRGEQRRCPHRRPARGRGHPAGGRARWRRAHRPSPRARWLCSDRMDLRRAPGRRRCVVRAHGPHPSTAGRGAYPGTAGRANPLRRLISSRLDHWRSSASVTRPVEGTPEVEVVTRSAGLRARRP